MYRFLTSHNVTLSPTTSSKSPHRSKILQSELCLAKPADKTEDLYVSLGNCPATAQHFPACFPRSLHICQVLAAQMHLLSDLPFPVAEKLSRKHAERVVKPRAAALEKINQRRGKAPPITDNADSSTHPSIGDSRFSPIVTQGLWHFAHKSKLNLELSKRSRGETTVKCPYVEKKHGDLLNRDGTVVHHFERPETSKGDKELKILAPMERDFYFMRA